MKQILYTLKAWLSLFLTVALLCLLVPLFLLMMLLVSAVNHFLKRPDEP